MKKKEIRSFILKLKRDPDSHKYNYGHILVIAGSKAMPGAGVLCCLGALRSGAGLVTCAVKDDVLNQVCSISKPEIMFFVYETVTEIFDFINCRKISSIIVGPGLKTDFSVLHDFIKKIIYSVNIPVILDAAGIACFNNISNEFKNATAKLIVTPHLGEFSKLLDIDIAEIKNNRERIVADFAKENSLICVLKGNNTVVSSGKKTYINNTGTPAMATAGSGDVLSGIISSFVNVMDDMFEAAKFAVFVHGLSGEFVEKCRGTSGVIASDIAENVCCTIKHLGA
ncbi:MAG: NAD(P)H-hydrate dehydratase [Endomicrobium sp.]|jgi:NAD(P)H-hydrate epimerase|nr:NAD(P)H-hydrate dehydratase [Endomicrobium sp.]